MVEALVKILPEYVGPGFAVLFFGFILGIMYMQKRCKSVQDACERVREINKEELLSKINDVGESSRMAIDEHHPACPNTASLLELKTKYEGEVTRIHHRISDIERHSEMTRKDVKDELRGQREFLDALAKKLINGSMRK